MAAVFVPSALKDGGLLHLAKETYHMINVTALTTWTLALTMGMTLTFARREETI